ncbi:MAG: hypothetical protein KAJ48_00585, partial [Elusimicrobiales bacterium]|nr:hypothetical protein [Elusimicrobiales bacterium]
NIKIARQYTVFLPNIPGALNKFIDLFTKESINIIGIASEIKDDSGIVKIAVEIDKKISYILTNAGFTTVETPMLSIDLTDKPGELLLLTKILAQNNINITTVYGTTLTTNKSSRILLNVSDATKALKILKKENV